jgi:hypothetical protein
METSPPNRPAAEPVTLDAAALARLHELDPQGRQGIVARVLAAFEGSLMRMLAQLAAERDGGQAQVVAAVAHTLKSSAASVGALRLASACAEVERRTRGGGPTALRHDVDWLLLEGEAALVAVRAMLPLRATAADADRRRPTPNDAE